MMKIYYLAIAFVSAVCLGLLFLFIKGLAEGDKIMAVATGVALVGTFLHFYPHTPFYHR